MTAGKLNVCYHSGQLSWSPKIISMDPICDGKIHVPLRWCLPPSRSEQECHMWPKESVPFTSGDASLWKDFNFNLLHLIQCRPFWAMCNHDSLHGHQDIPWIFQNFLCIRKQKDKFLIHKTILTNVNSERISVFSMQQLWTQLWLWNPKGSYMGLA